MGMSTAFTAACHTPTVFVSLENFFFLSDDPQEPVTLSQSPSTKSHNGAAAMDCSCRVRSEPKARRRLWVWHSDLGLRHEGSDGDGVTVCFLLVLLRYKGRPSEDDQAIQNRV